MYSELSVREWLQGFEGGKVHLEKCADTGVATIILDFPERKNALSGKRRIKCYVTLTASDLRKYDGATVGRG